MVKSSAGYRCAGCGAWSPRWAGRCAACHEWNLLEEEPPAASGPRRRRAPVPISLADTGADAGGEIIPTGQPELDRLLGGGLRPGTLCLLAGEPGIGKSTLVIQTLAHVAHRGGTVLLASGEESAEQVRRRGDRVASSAGAGGARYAEGLLVLPTGCAQDVVEAAATCDPCVIVVDSIHTMTCEGVPGVAGSPSQVAACLEILIELAQRQGSAVVVGHVTKDGRLAGPRRLEHLVDTVVWLEGDRHGSVRLLRATKHRHGGTESIGVLEMGERGLRSAEDPSRLLLRDRRPAPGSVVVPVLQGGRSLLVEVQALVDPRARRARVRCQGLDAGRVTQILAVLDLVNGSRLSGAQVFVSMVGGLRVTEPAADLAILVAVLSAAVGVPWPGEAVVFGEIGLTGELRQVPGAPLRLADSERLGFSRALAPSLARPTPGRVALSPSRPEDSDVASAPRSGAPVPGPAAGIRVEWVPTVADALVAASALMLGHPADRRSSAHRTGDTRSRWSPRPEDGEPARRPMLSV